ncbi:hypothetical protein CPAR01_02670 [Colletotrichum paranaense]|uniref:Uncharacterized protein n=1 Tax=Colletotrichum paranaense TaxID=1914294 RepID=A0ABQ9T081_9PEZI|nr:uncharacterized protein CPAR01_02670 [Colletotrichum paranaense]KAK1545168.1 hypothetical protein CPAR01_02670 [Colletotrichum paranaense]
MGPGGCGPGKTGVKVAGVRERRRRWSVSVGGISESAVGSCVAVAQLHLHLHLHLALAPLTLSKARNGRGGNGGPAIGPLGKVSCAPAVAHVLLSCFFSFLGDGPRRLCNLQLPGAGMWSQTSQTCQSPHKPLTGLAQFGSGSSVKVSAGATCVELRGHSRLADICLALLSLPRGE